MTIATGNNNNVDENKLTKSQNNNNKSPLESKLASLTGAESAKLSLLNQLPASWLLNFNKLTEAGNLGLLAGNLRNYHHLTGKFNETGGKIPDAPRIVPDFGDGNRLSPSFIKNSSPGSGGSAVEGKSSPSSRESPIGNSPRIAYDSLNETPPTEEKSSDKSEKSSSPVWPAWWSNRIPSPTGQQTKTPIDSSLPPSSGVGARNPMPMLVHPPLRSHDDQPQPLDFSVPTKNLEKFKPKMTISQTKTLINNLQNGHLNSRKNHSHRVNNNRHKHSFKSSSSSSAGSEDEGVGPPGSAVDSPGPLRGESGE